MIAADLQPFSVVEDIGFIRHLCPDYQIPSRKYFKDQVVQHIYNNVKEKL